MSDRMTHTAFARHAAQLASRAANWAGDVLILPEEADEPMHPDSVARFLASMRQHLDYVEKCAATYPKTEDRTDGR